MKRIFSSCRSVPTSPDGRYREATVTPGRSASTYRPLPSNSAEPKPIRTRSGSRRVYRETPARPLAAAGACTTCHPSGSRTVSGSCAASARTSWRHSTSAEVPASHSTKPFLAAARSPLTLTEVTVSTRARYDTRRSGHVLRYSSWKSAGSPTTTPTP